MLREIEKAVEALKAVPQEFHALVVVEASGKTGGKKRGPKPGSKRKPGAKKPGPKPKGKPGPKPKSKPTPGVDLPVKVDKEKLAKLKKLQAKISE